MCITGFEADFSFRKRIDLQFFMINVDEKRRQNIICYLSHRKDTKIGKIRKDLLDHISTLIHVFNTPRLVYCNSMLYAIPDYLLNTLQLLQNSAARLVTLARKNEHINLSYLLYIGFLSINELNSKSFSSPTKHSVKSQHST